MASLASLLEDYRNWRGRQEWEQGKGWQDFFGGDPRAQEQFEMLSGGFGTGSHGVGGMAGMIKASHGSPHAFEKFDFNKIGSGTGAQSYGYGGYFGQGHDSPVASGYRKIRDSANEHNDQVFLKQYHLDNARMRGDKEGEARALAALEELKANPPGYMYNVELRWPNAEKELSDPFGEHHLLSWDEKFNQQPKNVKDAVIKALHSDAFEASKITPPEFNANQEPAWMADLFANAKNEFVPSDYYESHRNRTGEQIYKSLVERLGGEKEATDLLKKHGLPGIRYLDEASRTAGKGTSNYVIFDDAIPEIVTRNGQPNGLAGMVK